MTPEDFQLQSHRGLHPRMARRRWLVGSLAAGIDLEAAAMAGVEPETLAEAQAMADAERAALAESAPVTFAIARDQYNNPIMPIQGNRARRRAIQAAARRLAKRRAKR